MKITFILQDTGTGAVGGVRVVYEYANRLIEKGHEVNIVYPLTPFVPRPKFNLRSLKDQARWIKGQARWLLHNLRNGKKIRWFNVKVHLIMIPTNSKIQLVVRKI